MKSLSAAAALFGLLSPVLAGAAQSNVVLPAEFKPPQVFKNVNLVHIISAEKSFVKDNINVVIENSSKEPQDEYYVPFTSEQMARVGGFEVKDRKNSEAGQFATEVVEIDPKSDTQYYKITLPSPLKAGGQQTLGISYYNLKAYRPLPASINQEEKQYLVHDFSAFAPSSYPTLKQKTEVKTPMMSIQSYSEVRENNGKGKTEKDGNKIIYGTYGEKPAGATAPAQVRIEFTKPVIHVGTLERDIEVSHWGGNVAFEERYELFHLGASLASQFNRAKWAQLQFFRPTSFALKDLRLPLQPGSVDPYFTDTIGNVTTSNFRSGKREALLELKPRYPLFGGWKYPFTVGWNSNADNLLKTTANGGYVLRVPFLEGPKQAEGIEYGKVSLRVLLPEGAENVKFFADLPDSSITETAIGTHKTFLDTVGRTSVTIKAQNLVDDFRDRNLFITYDTTTASTLRKPFVVFVSTLAIYVAAWMAGKVQVGFAKK